MSLKWSYLWLLLRPCIPYILGALGGVAASLQVDWFRAFCGL